MRLNSLTKNAVTTLVIILLLAPIWTACQRSPSTSATSTSTKPPVSTPIAGPPIKLGLIESFTGPMNPYGPPQTAAIELAVQDINAKGGVLGRKFEVITKDDQSKPDAGITVAKELILKDNANFLMGPISSAVALAISQVAKENKVLLITANARTSALTFEKGHRYIVQMAPLTTVGARNVALYVSKQPWKKVFTIGSDFEYSQTMTKEFVNYLKNQKPEVEIIGQSWAPLTTADMSAYIGQILQAKPDVVFDSVTGPSHVSLLKQGKPYDLFGKVPFVNSGGYSVEERVPLGQEAPDGMVGTLAYEFTFNNARNKDFVKAFREKTGNYPSHVAAVAYEGVYFLAAAINKAGTADTEKVIDAYESGLTRDTIVGNVTIRPYDHQAMWPELMGQFKKGPDYPFFVFQPFAQQNPVTQLFPSVEEVRKARGQ